MSVVKRLYTEVTHVLALAGAIWPHWPRLERSGRVPQPPRPPRVKLMITHDFERPYGGWQRCRTCWRLTSVKSRLAGVEEQCTGSPPLAASIGHGHRVLYFRCSRGIPLLICTKCGAWASQRARNLRQQCMGCLHAAGRDALRQVERGRHPRRAWGARVLTGGAPSRQLVPV